MERASTTVAALALIAVCVASTGCRSTDATGEPGASLARGWLADHTNPATLPSGTRIEVRLTSRISSAAARVGDTWTGTVDRPVTVGKLVLIHAGTPVRGVVTRVESVERGGHPVLELSLRRITSEGEATDVSAVSEPIAAPFGPGAAAGGIGTEAPSAGGRRDTASSGALGGKAVAGGAAASRGGEVLLRAGTLVTFTFTDQVAAK